MKKIKLTVLFVLFSIVYLPGCTIMKIDDQMRIKLDPSVIITGWKKINDEWFYFDAEGKMATGWNDINGNKYYMDKAGIMQTGWVDISGSKYYFDDSGAMQTGWIKDEDIWYYLAESGEMLTGEQIIDGKNYSFDNRGVCLNP